MTIQTIQYNILKSPESDLKKIGFAAFRLSSKKSDMGHMWQKYQIWVGFASSVNIVKEPYTTDMTLMIMSFPSISRKCCRTVD